MDRNNNDSIQKGTINPPTSNVIFSERDEISNKGTGASRSSVRAEGGVSEDVKQDTSLTGKGGTKDIIA